MKKSKFLKDELCADLERTEKLMQQAKDISDAVPYLQDRRNEIRVLLNVVDGMPDDVSEELTPKLIGLYQPSKENFFRVFPDLPEIDTRLYSALSSTGTASVYYSAISNVKEEDVNLPWLFSSKSAFEELANDKSRKLSLIEKLSNIHPNLGEIYRSAVDSFEKSKANIVYPNQTAGQMRDLIQQIWGALVEFSRQKCSLGIQGLELKKPAHREKVSSCLANTGNEKRLSFLLEELYNLYFKLSPIAKDPIFNDKTLLSNLYTNWILQIDDLISNLNFE
jgi:hypothetical protein